MKKSEGGGRKLQQEYLDIIITGDMVTLREYLDKRQGLTANFDIPA